MLEDRKETVKRHDIMQISIIQYLFLNSDLDYKDKNTTNLRKNDQF